MSPAAVRVLAPAFVDPLARTWRFRVRHQERWERLVDSGAPFIYLLWHEALLPLIWRHRRQQVTIVVSEAREGQYLSDFARRIGYQLLPGSSTRGGARALLGAIRALEDGSSIAITPDGPRGPRRAIKPGVVHAAQRSGAMILPLHATARSAWSANSWDKMFLPKPFAEVQLGYGEPFAVEPGAAGLEAGIAQCAASLACVERELSC